jgi:hypothetical protein
MDLKRGFKAYLKKKQKSRLNREGQHGYLTNANLFTIILLIKKDKGTSTFEANN